MVRAHYQRLVFNMATLNTFDPVGAFQGARRNALAMQAQEQDLALQPKRNALADLKLQQAKVGAEREQTQFDQGQALQRATIINQSARALKGLDPSQWPAAFKRLEPKLEQFGIPRGTFDINQATPEALDNIIAETQGFISNPESLSALDVARTEKLRAETEQLTSGVGQEDKRRLLDIREQELQLSKQQEQRQQTKLSAPSEKALISAQDATVAAKRSSTEFDILADQVEAADLTGGIASTTSETFKRLLGNQDDVTEFRRRFNSVRLSEGLKNLPPGPATDKDMAEAFKGVPAENAPSSQIASFLRGAAKMARFDAAYNQFKSDYISEKSSVKGLNKEWRRSVQSSALGRSVTMAEIYAEAADSGLTPEEVKQELGIEE